MRQAGEERPHVEAVGYDHMAASDTQLLGVQIADIRSIGVEKRNAAGELRALLFVDVVFGEVRACHARASKTMPYSILCCARRGCGLLVVGHDCRTLAR